MKNHRPRGLHWYGLPRMEDYPNNTQSIPVNRNIQNTLYDISIILKPKLEDSTRKKKSQTNAKSTQKQNSSVIQQFIK